MKLYITMSALAFSLSCTPHRPNIAAGYRDEITNTARLYFEIGAFSTLMVLNEHPELQQSTNAFGIVAAARTRWLNRSTNEPYLKR